MKDKGNELFANVKISVNLFNLFASVVGKLVVTLLLETKILKKKDIYPSSSSVVNFAPVIIKDRNKRQLDPLTAGFLAGAAVVGAGIAYGGVLGTFFSTGHTFLSHHPPLRK